MRRLLTLFVAFVAVASACGGGESPAVTTAAPDVDSDTSLPEFIDFVDEPDDTYLDTAQRATELLGGFSEAGVAILLAADAGYDVEQIISGIDEGGLQADGVITGSDGSVLAPAGPDLGIVVAAGAALVLAASADELVIAQAVTRADLQERFEEAEMAVEEAFGDDPDTQFRVLAAILIALREGSDAEETILLVVTGQLPDRVIGERVYRECVELRRVAGDVEKCITSGSGAEFSDDIKIQALGFLDAARAEYEFALEELCDGNPACQARVCADNPEFEMCKSSDGTAAPETSAPLADTQPGTTGTAGGVAEIADGTYEGEITDTQYQADFPVTHREATMRKDGESFEISWRVDFERTVLETGCIYVNRDAWTSSEVVSVTSGSIRLNGLRTFDVADDCEGAPGTPSRFDRTYRFDLKDGLLTADIGVATLSFDIGAES